MKKTEMRVAVKMSTDEKALELTPLAGTCSGRIVARAEKLLLEAPRKEGDVVTGCVRAAWGIELVGDPDNDTIRNLGIGGVWASSGRPNSPEIIKLEAKRQ